MPELGTHPGPQAAGGGVEGRPRRVRSSAVVLVPLLLVVALLAGTAALLGVHYARGTTYAKAAAHGESPVAARPAAADFRASTSLPPNEVLSSIAVPAGAHVVHVVDRARGGGMYDRQVDYADGASRSQILSFFSGRLRTGGWRFQGVVPAGGGREILAQRASGDGSFWQLGVTVPAVTGSSGTGAGASATEGGAGGAGGKSSFHVRLFELDPGA